MKHQDVSSFFPNEQKRDPSKKSRKQRRKRRFDEVPFFSHDTRQMWLPLGQPPKKDGRPFEVGETAETEENQKKNISAVSLKQDRWDW